MGGGVERGSRRRLTGGREGAGGGLGGEQEGVGRRAGGGPEWSWKVQNSSRLEAKKPLWQSCMSTNWNTQSMFWPLSSSQGKARSFTPRAGLPRSQIALSKRSPQPFPSATACRLVLIRQGAPGKQVEKNLWGRTARCACPCSPNAVAAASCPSSSVGCAWLLNRNRQAVSCEEDQKVPGMQAWKTIGQRHAMQELVCAVKQCGRAWAPTASMPTEHSPSSRHGLWHSSMRNPSFHYYSTQIHHASPGWGCL